jgi:hypothetical protein
MYDYAYAEERSDKYHDDYGEDKSDGDRVA